MAPTENNRRTNGSGNSGPNSVPPYDKDAEEALLGACLLSAKACEELVTKTKPDDFYTPANAHIAAAIADLFERDVAVDTITVADLLRSLGLIDQIGGPAVLITMQSNTPAIGNAGRYADIVHSKGSLRRLGVSAEEIKELVMSNPQDVAGVLAKAHKALESLAEEQGAEAVTNLVIPDMIALLANESPQEEPDILRRSDGKALLYSGKMHVMQSEPSVGKTWIGLYCVKEVLEMGGSVVYIDYEDTAAGIQSRLKVLGIDETALGERFQYVQPQGAMGHAERSQLLVLFNRLNPDLIIIDGVAEALSRDGYDEDRNTQVVQWFDSVPRWLARMGSCVVLMDHVTKNSANRGRSARGAGHKLAAPDGASYEVRLINPFSRERSGTIRLVVAKDRPGGVGPIKSVAADIQIMPGDDGHMAMSIEPPSLTDAQPGEIWKPTKIMERISKELERGGSRFTHRTIKAILSTFKTAMINEALARLEAEGFITYMAVGRTKYIRLVKPYTEGDEPIAPEVEEVTFEDLAKIASLNEKRLEKEEMVEDF